MSHLSHAYDTGASLYTTAITVADQSDPVLQWQRAKIAASTAIVEAGATITHHHAVGRDHAPWLMDEIGDLGVAILRSVKSTVDPTDTLNPGVLFRGWEG
jgi:alkyldihydroxyacetonephosphate synthase